MYYKDDFGFEVSIPKLPKETVIEAVLSSNETLFEMLQVRNKNLRRNSCKNPVVRTSET